MSEREEADLQAKVERELREALGPNAEAHPEFRASVRERFLGETLGQKSESQSSSLESDGERSAPDSMTEEHLNIEAELQQLPPTARANPRFRAELKSAFVAAEKLSAAPPQIAAANRTSDSRVEVARRSRNRAASPLSSNSFSWQAAVGLVAIAAAILMLVLVPQDREPVKEPGLGWEVVANGGQLEVDRVKYRAANEEALSDALSGAHSLASLDSSVELKLAKRVRLGLEPESLLELSPEQRASDELFFKLDSGEVHLMTSRDNPNQAIVVETPHAKVRIVGSVLSIEVFADQGTCICVKYGEADVEILSGESAGVRVGGDATCFVFANGAEPALGPSLQIVQADHLAPLLAFYDAEF